MTLPQNIRSKHALMNVNFIPQIAYNVEYKNVLGGHASRPPRSCANVWYYINLPPTHPHTDTLYATLSSLNKNVPLLHTQWGETAVYKASLNGHSEVMKLLVQAGADLELQTEVY